MYKKIWSIVDYIILFPNIAISWHKNAEAKQ